MKIEIGESLVYTWLRHVKQCQVVQMNWTPSDLWMLKHQSDLDQIMKAVDLLFPNYAIFGHKTKMPLKQFISHAEIDVMGSLDLGNTIFAVDVAFHENGLGYGGTAENAARVVKKCLRAAMCIYGYFDKKDAEVIFVSPKIHKKDWPIIEQNVKDLELELNNMGYGFAFKVICDQSTPDFQSEILDSVLGVINNIADTNELFVRSVQLLHMFYNCSPKVTVLLPSTPPVNPPLGGNVIRVGEIAKNDLRKVLASSSKVTNKDISDLQDKSISQAIFGINFPVLDVAPADKKRYYAKPVTIKGKNYFLCSQWYDRHRQALEDWIDTHK
jgi:hypothetical protein